ncbi:MAG: DUF2937 family protein [Pseudomonadota bacterium]
MGILSKSWVIGCGALGIATFSQAPEFTQQYKQRLGGGINELATVVSQFERDAANNGLTREQALEKQKASEEGFNQTRGESMSSHIARYENLLAQRQAMENAAPFMQPFHLFRYPDTELLSGTLNAYKPGIQLTAEGLIWGVLGGGLLGGLGRAPVSASRHRARRKSRPRITPGSHIETEEHLPGSLTEDQLAQKLSKFTGGSSPNSTGSPEDTTRVLADVAENRLQGKRS